MPHPEYVGVIATSSPSSELPIVWANLGIRMRVFNSSREAEDLARAFTESGVALVAHTAISDSGDLVVRLLLPPYDSAAILSPGAAESAGTWLEISAVVENY